MGKAESKVVAHARYELNKAKTFEKTEQYDGSIGRGILAMVKVFDDWFGNDGPKAEAAMMGFQQLLQGGLLSPPTTDPEEWEPVEGATAGTVRNKRCPFYVSTDNGKTWMHLQNKERGDSRDHITGEDSQNGGTQQEQSNSGRISGNSTPNNNVGGNEERHGEVTRTDAKPIGHIETTEIPVPAPAEDSARDNKEPGEGPAQQDGPGLNPGVAGKSEEAPGIPEGGTGTPETGKKK